jgi:hypothetical protein
MKIVKVIYTTKPEYADQNMGNIKVVMHELQKLNNPNIFYNVCVAADGKTFTHTAFFNVDDDQKILLELPAFKHFQSQLTASGLEVAPKQEFLTLVGASKNMFK